MATITVGQGMQFSTISEAVAASQNGDLIQVQAGTYTNDFATINTDVTLEGVGGMVKMVATGDIPNEKGILVTNGDVTVSNFEFSGAEVSSGNGAGIRYEDGDLVVKNSYFHDNQNGILANASETGTITITGSEFDHNGSGDGYTHNLYVNDVAKLTIQDSYFHDAVYGHEIKSRASVTEISGNRIYDNEGDASYSIDLPNGGQATVTNNVIQQGANSANPNIVAYGAEGNLHADSALTMSGNTIINEMAGRGAVLLNASNTEATFEGNSVYGANELISGSGVSESGTTTLASAPALDTSQPWSSSGSAAADAGGSSDAAAAPDASTSTDASATEPDTATDDATAGAATDEATDAGAAEAGSDASEVTDVDAATDSGATDAGATDASDSSAEDSATDAGTDIDADPTTEAGADGDDVGCGGKGGGHGFGHGRHEYLTGGDGDDTLQFGGGHAFGQGGRWASDGVFEGGDHDRSGGVSDLAQAFTGAEHAQLGLGFCGGQAEAVGPETTATADASQGADHLGLQSWRHDTSDFLLS